ncbi:MAG: hypothetical protein JXX28_11560 [Deltaproteobacteria bacterium]|nr:hypothetical protein [Deltaproteobacteria bacterium]
MIGLMTLLALGAEPVLIDAGSLVSPVLEGFSRLDLERCEDPRVRWETPPARVYWEQSPDPLLEDRIEGGTLRLTLEPGTWAVWMQLGEVLPRAHPLWRPGAHLSVLADGEEVWSEDIPEGDAFFRSPYLAVNPAPVFRPGETEWDRQTKLAFPWREAQIEVPPSGEVVLSTGDTPLMGMILAQDPAEAELLADVADLHRRDWYLSRNEPGARVEPVFAGQAQGVELGRWSEGPEPGRATQSPSAALTVSRGERLSVVLWVHDTDAPVRWSVEGLDGLGVAGSELRWLDQTDFYQRQRWPRPTWLLPSDGALVGGQGVPVGLALVGQIPEDHPPGQRVARVVLEQGARRWEVPLTVTVRDLTLLPPPMEVGFWFDVPPEASYAYGSGAPEVLDIAERHMRLMRAHGLDAVAIRLATPYPDQGAGPGRWPAKGPIDTSIFTELSRRWRALGGDTVVWTDGLFSVLIPAYTLPEGPVLAPRGEELVRAMGRAAVDADASLYLFDEGGGKGIRNPVRMVALIDWVRANGPEDLTLMGCTSHPVSWPYTHHLDLGCMHPKPLPDSGRFSALRDKGSAPVLYNTSFDRAGAGLLPWTVGVDLYLQWGWNSESVDAFNQARGGPRVQWNTVFPAPDGGVYSSVMLETFTEGLTDQRYLHTLERMVDELERRRGARWAERTERAHLLLDAARGAVDGHPFTGAGQGGMWSETNLDALRQATAAEAEYLGRWSRRPLSAPVEAP